MSAVTKIPYPKSPKTFAEQVAILQSHGLLIGDSVKAEFYLSQLNYYRLAAYCLPFEVDHQSHQVKPGTTFDDVLSLYIFDRELRLCVLDAIERIEVSLRTQMAYHLSHRHQTAHPHLSAHIFLKQDQYGAGLINLQAEVKKSNEDFIRHLAGKYQELLPPIWAVVELMTMGQLSKWFTNIKARQDRQAISACYGLDEVVMTSFCEHISLVRNICAHHSRLWNREITKKMMLPKRASATLLNSLHALPDSDRRLKKIYNTLTSIAFLMDVIAPGSQWYNRVKSLIVVHHIDTEKMGFPADWESRPLWQG